MSFKRTCVFPGLKTSYKSLLSPPGTTAYRSSSWNSLWVCTHLFGVLTVRRFSEEAPAQVMDALASGASVRKDVKFIPPKGNERSESGSPFSAPRRGTRTSKVDPLVSEYLAPYLITKNDIPAYSENGPIRFSISSASAMSLVRPAARLFFT